MIHTVLEVGNKEGLADKTRSKYMLSTWVGSAAVWDFGHISADGTCFIDDVVFEHAPQELHHLTRAALCRIVKSRGQGSEITPALKGPCNN